MAEEDQQTLLKSDEDSASTEMEDIAVVGPSSNKTTRRKRAKYSVNGRNPEHGTTSETGRNCKQSCGCVVGLFMTVLVAVVVALAVGLFVGYSLGKKGTEDTGNGMGTSPPGTPTSTPPSVVPYDWGDKVTDGGVEHNTYDWFSNNLKAEDIKNYLYNLTLLPHIAGSDRNRDLAVDIYKEWKTYGFDSVELVNYTVLLSYPNSSFPNSLRLMTSTRELLYNSHIDLEPPLIPSEDDPTVAPPFNAYAGHGNVSGPLVYVNYGRLQDFEYLTNGTGLSLNLSQYICIARYGHIFRGDKAHLAQRYGCQALLIYSDPQDYAPEGVELFPNGSSLPLYGVQRGSLQIVEGDVLTPSVPSIPGMYRRPYEEALAEEAVPRIPVQPISYGDAIHFMSQLSDNTPPEDWTGGLDIEYKIVQSPSNENFTELVVNNYQERRMIHNVVAKVYGSVFPDRQVILGNHRDAWVFGGADPNSGTATLLALAKVMGQLRKNDWRPGRTIVLCSWDAEEYGLIGSTEWVEDFAKLLGANALAYLNIDVAVAGSIYLSTSANPLLYEPIWQATKTVPCPNPGFDTIYDEWMQVRNKSYNGVVKPLVGDLGSGSDYTMFLQTLGISCTSSTYGNLTGYAVYHSVHDNFDWIEKFADPSFAHHRAVGLMWFKTALLLSTTPIPPNKPTDYGLSIEEIFANFQQQFGQMLDQQGISLDYLSVAVTNFVQACKNFEKLITNMTASPSIAQQLSVVRVITDKLMNMERAFIHPEGLPGRFYFKHVIFAPSSVNSYGSSLFPGISDSIFGATHPKMKGSWEQVKRQIDIVRTHLRHATQIMNDPSLTYAPTLSSP